MAVTMTPLTSGSASADGATTASITPGANALILAAVVGATTSDPVFTLTGNGLTWVSIDTVVITGPRVLNLFRALGASPSAGGVSINAHDTNVSGLGWSIAQFDGVDTGGTNGAGAIVQFADGAFGSGHSVTVTLSAFGDAGNATYGCFGMRDPVGSPTAGTGFTGIHALSAGGMELTSEWRADNDTTVDYSWDPAFDTQSGGIAIEIKAASGGAPTGISGHGRNVFRMKRRSWGW